MARAADDMERLESASSVRAAAVLENITMLKAGRAANQLTGASIEANAANIQTSVEAMFPDSLELVIDNSTSFKAYIRTQSAISARNGNTLR